MSTLQWSVITSTILVFFTLEICSAAVYTDKWAVQIEGGEEVAKRLAAEHGFTYLGQVSCMCSVEGMAVYSCPLFIGHWWSEQRDPAS